MVSLQVESQKQLEELQGQFEQIHSYNTELEIEIRTMKDKFRDLTTSQKYAIARGLFGVSDTVDSREHIGVEEFEQTEITKANDAELEAMEQFERVWKMPDEDYDDENEVVPVPVPIPTAMSGGYDDSMSTIDPDGDRECAPLESASRDAAFNSAARKRSSGRTSSENDIENDRSMDRTLTSVGQKDSKHDASTTRDVRSLAASGVLPSSPESNGVSIYEDQEWKEMPSTRTRSDAAELSKAAPPSPLADDPSRIEWFLNSCDSSEEEDDDDPEKILEITKRALAMAANVDEDGEDQNGDGKQENQYDKENKERKVQSTKSIPAPAKNNPTEPSPSEEDPSRIEWFLNNCDGAEEASEEEDPDKILAIATRALAINPLYKQDSNIDVASQQDDFEEEDDDDESESDSSDAIFKKKDAKDLRSMIKEDDLAALEARASLMAESLKTKLMDSPLADLSGDSESVKGAGKDRDSPKSFDLDISKIGSEDGDTTRNFVVMSDSILGESPPRNGTDKRDFSGDPLLVPNSRDDSNDSDSKSSGPPARAPSGESSAANVITRGVAESSSSSSPTGSLGYSTQNAGEPSQGDRRGMRESQKPDYSYFGEDDRSFPDVPPGEVGYDFRGPSPSKKLPAPKTLQFKADESFVGRDVSTTNKSYSLSDWSAVGNTASLLQDWSDSPSNSSLGDSYAESTSSLEATTRASALDTPLANEIDNLVAQFDWDGVKLAAEKIETSIVDDSHNLSIQEKRRKKRELEAWRTSISRSYTKSPEH
jgi:hypothetical protein